MSTMLDRVGRAIEKANHVRAFGLYDYSSYPGEAPPYVVRNELTGERILATWNQDEAQAKYHECYRHYLADAAIKAMDQWRFAAAGITSDVGGAPK